MAHTPKKDDGTSGKLAMIVPFGTIHMYDGLGWTLTGALQLKTGEMVFACVLEYAMVIWAIVSLALYESSHTRNWDGRVCCGHHGKHGFTNDCHATCTLTWSSLMLVMAAVATVVAMINTAVFYNGYLVGSKRMAGWSMGSDVDLLADVWWKRLLIQVVSPYTLLSGYGQPTAGRLTTIGATVVFFITVAIFASNGSRLPGTTETIVVATLMAAALLVLVYDEWLRTYERHKDRGTAGLPTYAEANAASGGPKPLPPIQPPPGDTVVDAGGDTGDTGTEEPPPAYAEYAEVIAIRKSPFKEPRLRALPTLDDADKIFLVITAPLIFVVGLFFGYTVVHFTGKLAISILYFFIPPLATVAFWIARIIASIIHAVNKVPGVHIHGTVIRDIDFVEDFAKWVGDWPSRVKTGPAALWYVIRGGCLFFDLLVSDLTRNSLAAPLRYISHVYVYLTGGYPPRDPRTLFDPLFYPAGVVLAMPLILFHFATIIITYAISIYVPPLHRALVWFFWLFFDAAAYTYAVLEGAFEIYTRYTARNLISETFPPGYSARHHFKFKHV